MTTQKKENIYIYIYDNRNVKSYKTIKILNVRIFN